MAQIVWTEPALEQLDEIAEYIAIDNPFAAADLVQRVISSLERLERFPNSGRALPELAAMTYREVVCSPCRVIYRCQGQEVIVLHVLRQERELRRYILGNDAR
jgi:toxin ParE1/3/4